jgi:hypothetical protein
MDIIPNRFQNGLTRRNERSDSNSLLRPKIHVHISILRVENDASRPWQGDCIIGAATVFAGWASKTLKRSNGTGRAVACRRGGFAVSDCSA